MMQLLLNGCMVPKSAVPPVGLSLIGKSRDEIFACAGAPIAEVPAAGGLILKYYNEISILEESHVWSKASRHGLHGGCWASISVSGNRVIGVVFESVPTQEVADEYCAQIFQYCSPAAQPS